MDLIRSDIDAGRDYFGRAITHAFPNLFVPVSHRIAHELDRRGLRPLAQIVAMICHVLTGAEIRPGATIGPRMVVVHPTGIVIGSQVVAGSGLALMGVNTLGRAEASERRPAGSPKLGDGVILLTHASVVGPVVVGDRVIVSAYSLVIDDMPDDARPRGVPARNE
ncbi:MAG: serine O-acetyltransferase [Thermoleophilaceae bacterium]|jgi:serine O-acetyltransferase|nr:serine O-acetyltransferase [Thermoleophilaceae bacterium]